MALAEDLWPDALGVLESSKLSVKCSELVGSAEKLVRMPTFKLCGYSWRLKLVVQHVDGDDWFGIYLEPVHEDCVAGKKRTGVTFQLRLHASAGEPVCKTAYEPMMIDDRSSGWGSPIFAKSTAITGVDSQYVDNGLLSVTVTMKVLLPVAARAAAGDALLVPADSAPVAAGSHYLSNASDVLATAIKLAQADAGQGQPMRIAVPHTSQRQAHLFVAAIYARDMPGLLDSLPAARLQELSNVAHKLACSEVLTAVDEAMLRKCGVSAQPPVLQSGWLKPDNALAALGWAQSRGLTGLQLKAAQYAAAHQKELSLEGAASDAGENLVLMLRCLQGTA